MTRDDLKKYLVWDVDTWGVGLKYIVDKLKSDNISNLKTLELGCNLGGISVCFINELGCNTLCTDLFDPRENVIKAHPEISKSKLITFDAVDGVNIKYSNATYDIVVFKSVLGFINSSEQQLFINEIYRILKPGGRLCFMENCKASFLHKAARKWFVSWGKSWTYVSYNDMKTYLSQFSYVDMHSNGFISAFIKYDKIKYLAYLFDNIIKLLILPRHRYVIYGIATK
jgi:ubiquinone/menaquinone biosynthesis C-methylase UbiE